MVKKEERKLAFSYRVVESICKVFTLGIMQDNQQKVSIVKEPDWQFHSQYLFITRVIEPLLLYDY